MAEMKEFIIENQEHLKAFYDKMELASGSPLDVVQVSKSTAENGVCILHAYLVENRTSISVSSGLNEKLATILEDMGPPCERK